MLSFGYTLALLSALYVDAFAASCSNFTVSLYGAETTYTQPGIRTYIVSKGYTCDSTSGPCKIPFGGYVTDTRTLNITTGSEDSIFELISESIDVQFNKSWTDAIGSQSTASIRNGTSGYLGFTPDHRCAAGRLSGCDGGDLEGVDVEACTPYSITRDDHMSGTVAEVVTDQASVDALTCNPANTSEAKSGTNSNNCSSADSSEKTGGASSLEKMSFFVMLPTLFVIFWGL